MRFGRQLQTALDRVARVLGGEAMSARPGRPPERIRSACALEVVALQAGSFELALDLRREQTALPGTDPGEKALETLVAGIAGVASDEEALPAGYDVGVLAALRDAGALFNRGVDGIELRLRTSTVQRDALYDPAAHLRVVERIQSPVHNRRTIEGRLLMADFGATGPKCRVHPPAGRAVECAFDESLEDAIYDNLRGLVRVTGEAEEDPETRRIKRLRVADVEPLEAGTEVQTLDADEFWREPTLKELAVEQGVAGPQHLDALVGAGADLWEDDDDLDRFLSGVRERRRRGRELEESQS